MKKLLLFFIDGIGIAAPSETNPIKQSLCPVLHNILTTAKPIDACLAVPGLPQSATGQTSMLTGQNAAEILGRHVEGFPGPRLQAIIDRENLLAALTRSERRVAFANAYNVKDIETVRTHRYRSVTTTCALSVPGVLRLLPRILENDAVYQDITRTQLKQKRPEVPLVTPEEAADHLLTISAQHDLTLFEYFQTDRAGHKGGKARVQNILKTLDQFCARLIKHVELRGITLAITSDHGNIEDLSVRTHTTNPVPWFTTGRLATLLSGVASLLDITPTLIRTATSAAPGAQGEKRPPNALSLPSQKS